MVETPSAYVSCCVYREWRYYGMLGWMSEHVAGTYAVCPLQYRMFVFITTMPLQLSFLCFIKHAQYQLRLTL